MATGPEGTASEALGSRYREILRRSGIDLRVVPTAGGVENLARLRDASSRVSVALIESGLTGAEATPELASLGTVALEPLWSFFRAGAVDGVPRRLQGKRISIEPEGSATRVLARRLLALNGLTDSNLVLLGLSPERSVDALLRGEIDGAVMLASWRSPAVRRLLLADGVVLESYPRADAYVALFPSLSKVVLPTGVADLARNIPPRDVPLLAVQTSLVVRRDLNPAIQYLLLQAAAEIHGGPEIFHKAGRFPAAEAVDLPLTDQAREYYQAGVPFVYRVLPLWLAGLTEPLLILLIPLLVVAFPLFRLLPGAYQYLVESRIYRLYGRLKVLEREIEDDADGQHLDGLAASLDDLARQASRLPVPLHYAQRLFILKGHIAMARGEVERRLHQGAMARF